MVETKKGNMHLLINHHFKNDLKRILRQDILDFGYPSSEIDDENVIYQFLALLKRLVKKRPRTIQYADTFLRPTDPIIEHGLSLFEEKVKNGEDLNPHLNKAMGTINYSDGLLFDWGIYHFHLGTSMDEDGYHVGRTGDILYAMVTNDTLYCIAVMPHGHWADKDLLEVVARNWEYLLATAELHYENPTTTFTSEETGELRKSRINVAQQLSNGKTYMSIGGGILGNGGNTEAQLKRMDLEREIERFTKKVDDLVKEDIVKSALENANIGCLEIGIKNVVNNFILKRVYDDKINLIKVTNGSHDVIDQIYFPIPSLKKIIYGY
jgi:hypothetical protein